MRSPEIDRFTADGPCRTRTGVTRIESRWVSRGGSTGLAPPLRKGVLGPIGVLATRVSARLVATLLPSESSDEWVAGVSHDQGSHAWCAWTSCTRRATSTWTWFGRSSSVASLRRRRAGRPSRRSSRRATRGHVLRVAAAPPGPSASSLMSLPGIQLRAKGLWRSASAPGVGLGEGAPVRFA